MAWRSICLYIYIYRIWSKKPDMTFGTYKDEALSTHFENARFDVLKGNMFCRFNVTYFSYVEGSTLLFMLHLRKGEMNCVGRF